MDRIIRLWHRHSVLRFLFVGALNTAFSFGVYTILVVLGIHFTIANLVALIAGILFSYHTNATVVFDHGRDGTFYRYLALWITLYILQITVIWVTTQLTIGWQPTLWVTPEILGGALALAVSVPTSFLILRFWVFASND